MFIGHAAVGLASKRLAPNASLGWLLAAPFFLDLLWPILLIAGVETVRIDPGNTVVTPLDLHDYPWSHSLLMSLVWSAVTAGAYAAFRRDVRGAAVIAAGVFSHWVLDFVAHRPDLPLYPGSETYVGLGLWNSWGGTAVVEGTLFVAGLWVYTSTTRPKDRTGSFALAALVSLLVVIYIGVLTGPPPPNVEAIQWTGLSGWLFVPWAAWIDRHRELLER
jgi:hypothetical protein